MEEETTLGIEMRLHYVFLPEMTGHARKEVATVTVWMTFFTAANEGKMEFFWLWFSVHQWQVRHTHGVDGFCSALAAW